ncbi:MAG: hypothetical protein ACREXR_09865 [Gammaproteobacteria bacterium]
MSVVLISHAYQLQGFHDLRSLRRAHHYEVAHFSQMIEISVVVWQRASMPNAHRSDEALDGRAKPGRRASPPAHCSATANRKPSSDCKPGRPERGEMALQPSRVAVIAGPSQQVGAT